jgi:hypothetical protein
MEFRRWRPSLLQTRPQRPFKRINSQNKPWPRLTVHAEHHHDVPEITDGTILNADINASAAIADSKLNLTTTASGTAISSTNKIVDAGSTIFRSANQHNQPDD